MCIAPFLLGVTIAACLLAGCALPVSGRIIGGLLVVLLLGGGLVFGVTDSCDPDLGVCLQPPMPDIGSCLSTRIDPPPDIGSDTASILPSAERQPVIDRLAAEEALPEEVIERLRQRIRRQS